eukprot:c37302_g1_i1 orf=3-164(-)
MNSCDRVTFSEVEAPRGNGYSRSMDAEAHDNYVYGQFYKWSDRQTYNMGGYIA